MSEIKCELKENDFYDWCNGMSKMLNKEANSKEKGLSQVNFYNISTNKQWCLGIVYRDSSKKDAHKLMLNLCPWCGSNILNESHLKKKREKKNE